MVKLIQQGAEAKIFFDKKNNSIIKERTPKIYRHPELDKKIRKRRTKSEKKLLIKASEIISIPKIYETKEFNKIEMSFIKGKKLSEHLNNFSEKRQKEICMQIGKDIAKLHKKDIIHGDLTTSNMIVANKNIFFIDFGLGYISAKIEDKAVDLHLLRQALEAKHFENWEKLYSEFKKGYEKILKDQAEKIFQRINAVEKRGRYRH